MLMKLIWVLHPEKRKETRRSNLIEFPEWKKHGEKVWREINNTVRKALIKPSSETRWYRTGVLRVAPAHKFAASHVLHVQQPCLPLQSRKREIQISDLQGEKCWRSFVSSRSAHTSPVNRIVRSDIKGALAFSRAPGNSRTTLEHLINSGGCLSARRQGNKLIIAPTTQVNWKTN